MINPTTQNSYDVRGIAKRHGIKGARIASNKQSIYAGCQSVRVDEETASAFIRDLNMAGYVVCPLPPGPVYDVFQILVSSPNPV